jgi:hypothetical protein
MDARPAVPDPSARATSGFATAGPEAEEAVADACDGDEPRPTLHAGATVRTAAYVGTLWGSAVGIVVGVTVLLVPWLDARADGTLGMLARGIAVGGTAGALIGALVDLENWMAGRMIGRRAPHRPPRR